MKNFDQDTSDFAQNSNEQKGEDLVKEYPVSRVVVNPAVFDLLRKNSLSDPMKRERWLITRLGESPNNGGASGVPEIPIFVPKGGN